MGHDELKKAKITFKTHDKKKKEDTMVTVIVRNNNDLTAARISSDFGEFRDHSENGPIKLERLNEVGKSELQNGGKTIIRIDPADPNDGWNFDFTLDLKFDDGTTIQQNEHNILLDKHNSQREFQIMHH